MQNIDIKILNGSFWTSEKARNMVLKAAAATQGSPSKELQANEKKYAKILEYEHPMLRKMSTIEIEIVGASRRFLAQVTKHKGLNIISSSLQYYEFSEALPYMFPAALDEKDTQLWKNAHTHLFSVYRKIAEKYDNDTAGYILPQSTRTRIIISATPFDLAHFISQRICKRNTLETQYIAALLWGKLYDLDPILFKHEFCGPACWQAGGCRENSMACGSPIPKNLEPCVLRKTIEML